MSGPIENLCYDIMSGVANISSDPNRALEPYYKYGSRHFNTNEGVPPQVRIKKGNFSISQPIIRGGPTTYNTASTNSGSLGTIEQVLQFKVWGENEAQVLTECNLICQSITKIKAQNSQNVSQPPIQDNMVGQWFDIVDHDIMGEVGTFEYTVFVNIPERTTDIVLISSSMNYVSMSNSLTGSGEGWRSFNVTGSV
jgi:hypothetical protein